MPGTTEIPEGKELDREVAEAYRYYQNNIRKAGESVYAINLAARAGATERELLEMALDCLDRMLDEPVGEKVRAALRARTHENDEKS